MFLREAKAKFNTYPSYLKNVKPCTIDEVYALEQILNCKIPESYREFLLWMGHSGGGFLQGTDIFYKDILNLQVWARELLVENNFPQELPSGSLVFMMHQGYQFMFFQDSDKLDPPVYFYHEAFHVNCFELRHSNLNEFLVSTMENEVAW